MLTLHRKSREKLLIGHNIVVTVLKVEFGRVTLGISAPSYVSVKREEIAEPGLLNAIIENNKTA